MRAPSGLRPRAREAGQVLVIFVFALVTLMAAAGLAVDVGRFYSERRFLQNAADAAALAAGNVLVSGGTEDAARTEARAVLAQNFSIPPNGIVPALPPANEADAVYQAGHAGDPAFVIDGILVAGAAVRVAVRNTIPYTFGRAVGLDTNMIVAQARVRFDGDLLPIAVRQYIKAPGSNTGVPPCADDFNRFMDFFATANTACLGTDGNTSSRINPSAGSDFSASMPDGDRSNHGPIVEILGQGADPDNAADFRGFVALDIRNFQSASSQLYYDEVTASTNAQQLKDLQAQWILDGYPGPPFPAAVSPPAADNQVAIMSGNSAGIVVSAFSKRFAPSDEILVAVYPGVTMQIPDFTMSTTGDVSVDPTGTAASAGSIRVRRNQAFSGTVTLSTVSDVNDPASPLVLGTLLNPASPITYDPNPVTPSLGSGTSVALQNVQTASAAVGIYALWLKGQAGSPYLTTKYAPFALKVGTVAKDFLFKSDSSEQTAAAAGSSVAFTLSLKRSGGVFGAAVNLSLEALAGETLPAGLGTVTFSPTAVTPTNSGASSTLTIATGTMAPGRYQFTVRATGTNGDAQKVTRLMILTVYVGTSSSGGNQAYVDIVGFAVMRVAGITSNSVTAYAITPVIADPLDSRLRRGQVARLSPWND